MLDEEPPEGHECSVGRLLACTDQSAPLSQRGISGFCAIDVDALRLRGLDAVLTETRNATTRADAAVIGAEQAPKWPLPFAAPHQAIDIVRT